MKKKIKRFIISDGIERSQIIKECAIQFNDYHVYENVGVKQLNY